MLCSPHHSPVVGGPFILPTSTLSPQQILYSPQALPVPPLLLTTFNLLISECPPLSWMSPVNADEQNHRKGGVIRLHIYFTSRLGNSCFSVSLQAPFVYRKGQYR